jgi:hypothetical protein
LIAERAVISHLSCRMDPAPSYSLGIASAVPEPAITSVLSASLCIFLLNRRMVGFLNPGPLWRDSLAIKETSSGGSVAEPTTSILCI